MKVALLRSLAVPAALVLLSVLGVQVCAVGQANNTAIVIKTIWDLQDMQTNLSGNYVLGSDIDASVTATWNGGAGFLPVSSAAAPFTGILNGNGHRITGLFIYSGQTNVGLAFGQSVTLTATISSVLPEASTPTGTVTFVDGNAIGTVPVSSGVAVLTTPAFASGVHRIIASYSGDSNFNASQSSEAGYIQFVASPSP
jgi:hypothetical protein